LWAPVIVIALVFVFVFFSLVFEVRRIAHLEQVSPFSTLTLSPLFPQSGFMLLELLVSNCYCLALVIRFSIF
jgi:hypothetical protein